MQALAAVPTTAKEVDQGDVWRNYVTALADQLELANSAMVGTYDTMRDVLALLDVPLLQTVADATGMGYQTAWTKDSDQRFVDLNAMGGAVVGWLREAADGSRAIILEGDRWGLEQKPDDQFSIQIDPDTREPFRAAISPGVTNGVPGTLGNPVWLVALGVIASVAVIGAYIYLLVKLIGAARDIMLAIIDYWNVKTQYSCLDKNTAEECQKLQAGTIELTKTINEGRKAQEPTTPGSELEKGAKSLGGLATTLLWVAFGGAVIYVGAKVVPPLLEDMQQKRRAAHA
jgi:hypothetical protein